MPHRTYRLAVAIVLLTAFGAGTNARVAYSQSDLSQTEEAASIARLLGLPDGALETDSRASRYVQEREAVSRFLASRKIVATDEAITRKLDDVDRVFRARSTTLADALTAEGISREELQQALRIPIAWEVYLRTVITEERIQAAFDKNRQKYDGTTVSAAQVFLRPSDDRSKAELRSKAAALRTAIISGQKIFDEVARSESNAASAASGGQLGWIRYRGDVPQPVADWAFGAEPGDISEPIESSLGIHLVTVTGRKQGERSLEDARTEVVADLSDQLWSEAVEAGRR